MPVFDLMKNQQGRAGGGRSPGAQNGSEEETVLCSCTSEHTTCDAFSAQVSKSVCFGNGKRGSKPPEELLQAQAVGWHRCPRPAGGGLETPRSSFPPALLCFLTWQEGAERRGWGRTPGTVCLFPNETHRCKECPQVPSAQQRLSLPLGLPGGGKPRVACRGEG